ncbi:MAG: GNAT family N-acetyltransferase [Catenulispora sp. 13_1_20CM_3_70_7]|nr:MAG: GNAT family N-acetyltransferase [Catenulispora sp. 13_1_20CM_3_70_7]
MADLDPTALLGAYDDQLRARVPDPMPAGWWAERDGPVVRVFMAGTGFVGYRSVAGLAPAELDALIARQRDVFAARGEPVEWKWHSHDRPADLPERLRAAGYQPEQRETVLVGRAEPLAAEPVPLPVGVLVRPVHDRVDLDRIAAMEEDVWKSPRGWLADGLAAEVAADPDALTILVAEAGDTVVSAAWVRYVRGTDFASLWGGSTLEEWRHRAIYRALVAARARLALDRGYRYLQVDASEDSRPILARLGFVALTETVPYVFTPPGKAAPVPDR